MLPWESMMRSALVPLLLAMPIELAACAMPPAKPVASMSAVNTPPPGEQEIFVDRFSSSLVRVDWSQEPELRAEPVPLRVYATARRARTPLQRATLDRLENICQAEGARPDLVAQMGIASEELALVHLVATFPGLENGAIAVNFLSLAPYYLEDPPQFTVRLGVVVHKAKRRSLRVAAALERAIAIARYDAPPAPCGGQRPLTGDGNCPAVPPHDPRTQAEPLQRALAELDQMLTGDESLPPALVQAAAASRPGLARIASGELTAHPPCGVPQALQLPAAIRSQ